MWDVPHCSRGSTISLWDVWPPEEPQHPQGDFRFAEYRRSQARPAESEVAFYQNLQVTYLDINVSESQGCKPCEVQAPPHIKNWGFHCAPGLEPEPTITLQRRGCACCYYYFSCMQMRRPRLTSAELKFIKRLPEAWREGLERLLREICSTSKGSKGQKSEKSVTHSVVSDSLTPWTAAHWTLCPWDSPGKNTRVGCHGLLQGIFPILGLNSGLPRWRQILSCRTGA